MKEHNVQPIRSLEEIQKMKDALLRYCSYRDYFLFVLGINIGLRITDLLPLHVYDIRGKTYINVKERKTKKTQKLHINKELKHEIEKYTKTMQSDDYLFPSRKGDSHLTPTQAYRILQKAANIAGIEHTATRSLRKTFGYHHYKKHKNLAMLQKLFSQSTPSITKRYIGITNSEKDFN